MRKCLLVLIGLLVTACDQQPIAPVSVDQPAFSFMNNPDNGNFRIDRYESAWRSCWTDFSNGLRVCNATFPVGDPTDPDCDLQQESWPLDNQEVVRLDPEDIWNSEVHLLMKGPVFITVRNTTVAGTCYDNELIAEGWGMLQNTDNDLFGTGESERNANTFGYLSHGVLTTPAGEKVSYVGKIRWRYSNTAGLRLLTRTVSVTP